MSGAPDSFKTDLLALLPSLRAFAFSLARNRERADDLVQDTVIRAWEKHASFTEGTNMRAWLFTILRNCFYSEIRKRRREVEDVDDAHRSAPSRAGIARSPILSWRNLRQRLVLLAQSSGKP